MPALCTVYAFDTYLEENFVGIVVVSQDMGAF